MGKNNPSGGVFLGGIFRRRISLSGQIDHQSKKLNNIIQQKDDLMGNDLIQ